MTDEQFIEDRIKRLKFERGRVARHEVGQIRDDLLKWLDRRIAEEKQKLEPKGN